jgi:hypothetical protein
MRALCAAMHSLFLAACTENIHAMLRSKEKGKKRRRYTLLPGNLMYKSTTPKQANIGNITHI